MKRWLAIVGCSLLGLTAGAGLAIVVGRALEEWEHAHPQQYDPLVRERLDAMLADVVADDHAYITRLRAQRAAAQHFADGDGDGDDGEEGYEDDLDDQVLDLAHDEP